MADLSRDAYHYAKLRTSGTAARRGRPDAGQDKNKVVLTMDDLSLALGEHGVNARKPDYCEPPFRFHPMQSLMGRSVNGRK